jgi:heat shock protein beta
MLDQEIEEREGVSGEKVEEVDAETGETLPAADAEEKEAPVDDEEEPKKAPFDDSIAEKTGINPDKYDRSDKKNRKVEYRWYYDWELMNPQRPIWTRNPQNVTEEEYSSFYKAAFEQTEDPMTHLHFHAEGDVDFAAILFVPKTAEDNQLQKSDQHLKNIKLFVKRVFITNELMDFMPRWLGFVRGMVDSDDLPLNVSRETLQKHRLLKLIRRKMIRKCLDLIKTLSLDESKYEEFLKEYGVNLKLGVIEDAKNRKKIMKLLRVTTSKAKKKISLETYVQRMKPNQEQIYFLTGNSVDEIKRSPFVEPFVARGYEVIYFDEPIDEYLVQALKDFQHKPFQNIAKAGVKLPDEEDVDAETTEKFVPLTNYLLLQFGDAIENVKLSSRLVTSPCSLVANSQGWSGHMEKMMSAQAIRTQNDEVLRMFNAQKKKVLEINPKHPIINNLLERVLEDKHDPQLKENTVLLFELTQLRSGFEVADQNDFTTRIEGALKAALGVPLDAKVEGVDEVFAEEEEEIVPDTPETPLDGEVAEAAGESDVVEAEETEEDESEVEFNSKRRRAEYTAEEEHKEWKEERERLEAAEEKAHREGLERQKEQRLKEERAKRKKVKRADDEDLPDDDHDEL